jgi:hypothetical protein
MKFTEIKTNEEEVIQFLKDVGFEGFDPDEIEVTDKPTLKDQMESIEKRIRMIDDLYDIAIELDSRETSVTLPVDRFHQFDWNELCNKGIEILEKLKSK